PADWHRRAPGQHPRLRRGRSDRPVLRTAQAYGPGPRPDRSSRAGRPLGRVDARHRSDRARSVEAAGQGARRLRRSRVRAVASGAMDVDDGYFGEPIAARYDEAAADMFDPAVVDPAVDFLAELAGSGRALELGSGTGRIALPLAQRGVPVHGIERSRAMAARLRAKP